MKISIIIPALNEERVIGRVLRTIGEQAERELHQIIVADGGSSDRTVEVAAENGADVITCGKRGRAVQMNCGAEAATGDLYYFLHADTTPPAGFDREIRAAVRSGAGAGCFRLQFTNDHPVLRFYSWCTRFKATILRFGDQSLFVKPDLFSQIGGFNESLVLMEDQQIVRDLTKVSSFMVLEQYVRTSSRKYEDNGVFRLQLIFTIILVLYYAGASQELLVHLYRSLIDT